MLESECYLVAHIHIQENKTWFIDRLPMLLNYLLYGFHRPIADSLNLNLWLKLQ